MSSRFVNLGLLFVSTALVSTGVLLFATSRVQDAWVYEAHRLAGAALLILLVPKTRIIFRSLKRRWMGGCVDLATVAAVLLTGSILLAMALAFAWTFDWLPFYFSPILGATPMGLHWYVAFELFPLLAWHIYKRWVPVRRNPNEILPNPLGVSRRTALSFLTLGGLALVGFGLIDGLAGSTRWPRRFSGSRLLPPSGGNGLQVTSSEPVPQIDAETWRLRLTGRVSQPLELSLTELLGLGSESQSATLDCTLGWASTEDWRGVTLAALLSRAGASADARTITCRAVSGYYATISIEESQEALIATRIGSQVLSPEHGFPARLVTPTRRGYHWIKWMSEINVS